MRRALLLVSTVSLVLAACADGTVPPRGEGSPETDTRRITIYGAVIRDVVEFRDRPVYVWTKLCANADAAAESYAPCPDELTAAEQDALAAVLSDEMADLRFVDETKSLVRDIFDRGGAELVRLGPIREVEGRVQVPAMHYCGGLCGGGSVWVVEQRGDDWTVTGPAPGHGVWIS